MFKVVSNRCRKMSISPKLKWDLLRIREKVSKCPAFRKKDLSPLRYSKNPRNSKFSKANLSWNLYNYKTTVRLVCLTNAPVPWAGETATMMNIWMNLWTFTKTESTLKIWSRSQKTTEISKLKTFTSPKHICPINQI